MGINIALTKGRLEKETVKILERAGMDCKELKDKGRKLVFNDGNKEIKYFLVKSNDALTYVEHGVADLAVVGKDTILEGSKNYYEIMDLNIGKCKFIVASIPGIDLYNGESHVKIASKYPNVAREYFKNKHMDVEVIKIDGSVELAPILGLCNGIVDIMETGTTLKENGLIVLDEICDLSARVIVNKASFKMKQKEITELIDSIEGVL